VIWTLASAWSAGAAYTTGPRSCHVRLTADTRLREQFAYDRPSVPVETNFGVFAVFEHLELDEVLVARLYNFSVVAMRAQPADGSRDVVAGGVVVQPPRVKAVANFLFRFSFAARRPDELRELVQPDLKAGPRLSARTLTRQVGRSILEEP
jgi:hypothetical protein